MTGVRWRLAQKALAGGGFTDCRRLVASGRDAEVAAGCCLATTAIAAVASLFLEPLCSLERGAMPVTESTSGSLALDGCGGA